MSVEEDEFREWVVITSPRLVRTAHLLTGDRGLAEDLVQTTLLRLWPKWHQIRADYPEAYARTVMTRLQASAVRRRWRGEIPTEVLPERGTHRDETDDLALRQGLARLPLGQRTIVVLRYVDDLPVSEVARIVDCSEGNVKSQASRGLKALQALMAEGKE